MNVNSTSNGNTYSALNSSSKGLSGLASGMDTEEMVAKMLEGQTKKIEKQKANKQVAQWKQNMYRDTITRINTFNKKFFDFTSPTALMSNSFFNQMKAVTSSSHFRVTGASSEAISGEMRLKIDQLATQTSVEGADLKSSISLSGKFDDSALDSRVSFQMKVAKLDADGKPVLDANKKPVYDIVGGFTLDDKDMKELLDKGTFTKTLPKDVAAPEKGNYTVKFGITNGKLSIESGDDLVLKISEPQEGSNISTTQLGLDKLGLSVGLEGNKFEGIVNREAGATLDITLDGNTKKIVLDKGETQKSLQDKLDYALGKNAITLSDVTANAEGVLKDFSLTTTAGRKITIAGSKSGLAAAGMKAGQSNLVGIGDTIGHALGLTGDANGKMNVEINGVQFEFSKDDTIMSMQSRIKNSDADVELKYNEFSNKFTFIRKSSGVGFDMTFKDDADAGSSLLGKLMGVSNGAPLEVDATGKPISAGVNYSSGQNSIITLNGVTTERSSNNFTIAGVSFELLSETPKADPAEAITTTRNTDSIFDGIKSFVDEYNSLIKDLTKVVESTLDYKDYPPLTDQQRKDMSQGEIDAWEKKAQVGLLAGDSNIGSFLSQLRLSLYQKPANAKYSMFDIGIETTDEVEKRGELKIDEAQLKEMINKDPTAIADLFTFEKTKEITVKNAKGEDQKQIVPDGTQGIAIAFRNIIKATANTSSGSPGVLTQIAGYENTASEKKNMMYDQMKLASDRITLLTRQYEQQKKRYWSQFTQMEQVVSNLNSQSSWLMQQTGG